MKTRKGSLRSKTFTTWLLSYILLMLIPLVFGCMIYQHALNTIREDVDYVQKQTLMQVRESLESNLYMCDQIGLMLTNSDEAQGLRYFSQSDKYTARQMMYPERLIEEMGLYSLSNEMITEVMMYFPKTDYILRGEGFCPLEYTDITADTEYRMGLTELRQLALREGMGLHSLDNGKDGLLYVYSLYGYGEQVAEITVLIYLDAEIIGQMVNLPQSSLYLTLSDNSWFSTSGQEFPEEWWMSEENGAEYELLSTDEEYLMYLRSQGYNLSYVNVIEKEYYLAKTERMMGILVLYVICSVLVGVTMAWFISRRNYQPVKELLELTSQTFRSGERDAMTGDFSVIRTAYQDLLSAYKDKEERMRRSRVAERNSWMNELLKGRISGIAIASDSGDDRLKEMTGEYFALLSVEISDMGSMTEGDADEVSTEVIDMAYFIVQNILHEMLSENYPALEAETDGRLFALVNLDTDEDAEATLNDLKRIGLRTCEFIRANFGMQLMINISDIHPGRSQIRNCYDDIQDIPTFRDYEGQWEEPVVTWRECQENLVAEEDMEEIFGKLKTFIRHKNFQEAEEMLRRMKSDADKETPSQEEETSPVEDNTSDIRTAYPQSTDGTEKQIDLLMDQVASYIQEHYKEGMLSAGLLADEFHLGLSYMSRCFKKRHGVGILDYVNRLRLEDAKRLIAGGATVKEAAEQVGYFNTQPLIRVFRQMEGMTPSEYRNSLVQK